MLLSQTPALSPIKSADNKTEKRQQAKLKDDERLEDLGQAIVRKMSNAAKKNNFRPGDHIRDLERDF
jgi:hypothetical protein